MSNKLRGKVAVVTGSGRGIGRAMAIKLASEGARVVVNDLDDGPAQAVCEEIRALGGEALACSGSVTAPEFADRIISAAPDAGGGRHGRAERAEPRGRLPVLRRRASRGRQRGVLLLGGQLRWKGVLMSRSTPSRRSGTA